MNNWTKSKKVLSILSLLLIAACATSKTSVKPITALSPTAVSEEKICNFKPEIPIQADDAFFPLMDNGKGVFYSWDECIFFGLKCKYQEVQYLFENPCHMQWFINNGYGLQKQDID